MLEDDKGATARQNEQISIGQRMALSAAVHALIATHPNPKAFAASFAEYDRVAQEIFLRRPMLQGDDGMRQAYGEVRASLLGAMLGS